MVITADQRDSRRSADAVPCALKALDTITGFDLGWERTAGDEVQAMTTNPQAAVRAVICLVRQKAWRIGLGIGGVQTPLPDSTRAARGTAYVHARTAVDRARRTPVPVAVNGAADHDAEDALWLLVTALERRTPEGWQVSDLLDEGVSRADIARTLQISRSAVSQRASRAAWEVVWQGTGLAERALARQLEKVSAAPTRLAP